MPYHELDNKVCLPCNIIEHCISCYGEKDYTFCSLCDLGYELEENKCQKKIVQNCVMGEKEKCKNCSYIQKDQCDSCNEGYFLPENEENKNKCEKCDLDGCLQCFGTKKKHLCLNCKEGYKIINGFCEEETCSIGENEKCASCRTEIGRKKECLTCNVGYYLEKDNEDDNNGNPITKCEKCDLDGCLQCSGSKANKKCLKCKEGYIIMNGFCKEETCSIGENEKCASCRTEIGRKKECLTCNDGYYIKTNENSFRCIKCSILNCKSCYFHLNKEYCQKCNENFEVIKNPMGLIENCTCPSGLKYFRGLCVEEGNWLEIEINISDVSRKYQIMDTKYTQIKENEIDVYVNNSIVPLEKLEFSTDYLAIYYKFEQTGFYKIKMNIKKTLYSMEWMFTNQYGIKSVKFLPGFDSSKVTNMDYIFACTSFESIDMKYLDTRNLYSMRHFLEYSKNIKSLDLSSFNTSRVYNMEAMFNYNDNLEELDLSSLDTSKVDNCIKMFHDISPNCVIKISNKFTKCRELIPVDNKMINVDDESCKNFDNCEICKGSKETLYCYKCKIGYQLIDNNCIKPKCELGENEKCLSCNNLGNEDECLECNEGYTIANTLNKKICTKCEIEGCKKCDNSAKICQECKQYYIPYFNKNTGNIINCNLLCELGSNDKCLTCNTQSGYESQCGSCNEGYKLINGKCKKIENSFIAIYNVSSISHFTRIMCLKENNIKLNNFNMYVNDEQVYPNVEKGRFEWYDEDYVAYKFNKLGKHKVKIIFNKTLSDMKHLFLNCYDLISIEFNEAFDSSHVLCMYFMFGYCDSLEKINISSFNTSLVADMFGMFEGLDSLTSLNLSNFDSKNLYSIQQMFASSEQLNFIDISSFVTDHYYVFSSTFRDISSNGIIIINRNFKRLDELPNGWIIKYKQ